MDSKKITEKLNRVAHSLLGKEGIDEDEQRVPAERPGQEHEIAGLNTLWLMLSSYLEVLKNSPPPPTLNEVAEAIRTAHERCQASPMAALLYARDAGEWLLIAAEQMTPAQWSVWLQTRCHLSERSAETYMQMAKGWPGFRTALKQEGKVEDSVSISSEVPIISPSFSPVETPQVDERPGSESERLNPSEFPSETPDAPSNASDLNSTTSETPELNSAPSFLSLEPSNLSLEIPEQSLVPSEFISETPDLNLESSALNTEASNLTVETTELNLENSLSLESFNLTQEAPEFNSENSFSSTEEISELNSENLLNLEASNLIQEIPEFNSENLLNSEASNLTQEIPEFNSEPSEQSETTSPLPIESYPFDSTPNNPHSVTEEVEESAIEVDVTVVENSGSSKDKTDCPLAEIIEAVFIEIDEEDEVESPSDVVSEETSDESEADTFVITFSEEEGEGEEEEEYEREILTLFLPGIVVPKARPRVTSNGTFLPQRYREWREMAEFEITRQLTDLDVDIEFPIKRAEVTIRFVGKHRTNSDLDNMAGACLDALTLKGAGVLQDDRISCVSRLSVEYEPKAKETGVIIEIEPIH